MLIKGKFGDQISMYQNYRKMILADTSLDVLLDIKLTRLVTTAVIT